MSLEAIKGWLGDPSAEIAGGIALYALHGRNRHLLHQFRTRKDPAWVRAKLVHELTKLLPATRHVVPVIDFAPVVPSHETKSVTDEPGEILVQWDTHRKLLDLVTAIPAVPDASSDDIAREKSRLFGERAKLSNSLHKFDLTDDAGRKAVVEQIKELTRRMNALRMEQEGGDVEIEAPAVKFGEMPTEVGALYQERNNLRSNLTKARRSLSRHQQGSAGWLKYTRKIEAITARLDEVERRLK